MSDRTFYLNKFALNCPFLQLIDTPDEDKLVIKVLDFTIEDLILYPDLDVDAAYYFIRKDSFKYRSLNWFANYQSIYKITKDKRVVECVGKPIILYYFNKFNDSYIKRRLLDVSLKIDDNYYLLEIEDNGSLRFYFKDKELLLDFFDLEMDDKGNFNERSLGKNLLSAV